MKIRILTIITLLTLIVNVLSAQVAGVKDMGSYKSNFFEGNLLLEEKNYPLALEYFKLAYNYDSTNSNINYHVGSLYLHHSKFKHLAENYLERAVLEVKKNYDETNAFEKKAPARAFLDLGKAYHLDYKFDEAMKMYETYESYLNLKDKRAIDEIEHYRKQVFYAKEYKVAPRDVSIINLGDSINTIYPDFSPVVSADERLMIFTHRGPVLDFDEMSTDGFVFENIMITEKLDNTFPGTWSKPKSISNNINTGGSHEDAVAMSADGQTIVIYKDDEGDGNLYHSLWDGKDWSAPIKYGSNINTAAWEPSACLARDGNTIYFVSDRSGGIGGRDIYKSVKLPNGQWSLAKNLGPKINTAFDEESPFLAADDMTFFFSSQGHQSMGGFDIMFAIIAPDGTISEPLNMGYPVNTTDDDLYYVSSPDNKRGYYASAHEDSLSKGDMDIYMIQVNIPVSHPMVLFKGKIITGTSEPLPDDVLVVVTNKASGEVIGNYRPHKNTGNFATILEPNKTYNFSYQVAGKEVMNEDVVSNLDIVYQEIQKAINLNTVVLNNSIKPTQTDSTNVTANSSSKLKVWVLNSKKDKKPIEGAKVVLTTDGAATQEFTTDANGSIADVTLAANKKYSLQAFMDKKTSYKENLATFGTKADRVFEKTLYVNALGKDVVAPDNSVVSGTTFKFFFKYNMNEVDASAPEFVEFISNVAAAHAPGTVIKLKFIGSASTVPTKAFNGNTDLAMKRVKATEAKIQVALEAKGIPAAEFKIVSELTKVQGPAYKGDAEANAAVYEKFQYIQVIAK